jgi:hypothetical protein
VIYTWRPPRHAEGRTELTPYPTSPLPVGPRLQGAQRKKNIGDINHNTLRIVSSFRVPGPFNIGDVTCFAAQKDNTEAESKPGSHLASRSDRHQGILPFNPNASPISEPHRRYGSTSRQYPQKEKATKFPVSYGRQFLEHPGPHWLGREDGHLARIATMTQGQQIAGSWRLHLCKFKHGNGWPMGRGRLTCLACYSRDHTCLSRADGLAVMLPRPLQVLQCRPRLAAALANSTH